MFIHGVKELSVQNIYLGTTQIIGVWKDGYNFFADDPAFFPYLRNFSFNDGGWSIGYPYDPFVPMPTDGQGLMLNDVIDATNLEFPEQATTAIAFLGRIKADLGEVNTSISYSDLAYDEGNYTGVETNLQVYTYQVDEIEFGAHLLLNGSRYDESTSPVEEYTVEVDINIFPGLIQDAIIGAVIDFEDTPLKVTLYAFDVISEIGYYKTEYITGDFFGYYGDHGLMYNANPSSSDRATFYYVDQAYKTPEQIYAIAQSMGYTGGAPDEIPGGSPEGIEFSFPYEIVFSEALDYEGWSGYDPSTEDWVLLDDEIIPIDSEGVHSTHIAIGSLSTLTGSLTYIAAISGVDFQRLDIAANYDDDPLSFSGLNRSFIGEGLTRQGGGISGIEWADLTMAWGFTTWKGPSYSGISSPDTAYIAFTWDQLLLEFRTYIYSESDGGGYWQLIDTPDFSPQEWGDGFSYKWFNIEAYMADEYDARIVAVHIDDEALDESDIRTVIAGWGYTGGPADEWTETDITTFPYEINFNTNPEALGWSGDGEPLRSSSEGGLYGPAKLRYPSPSTGAVTAIMKFVDGPDTWLTDTGHALDLRAIDGGHEFAIWLEYSNGLDTDPEVNYLTMGITSYETEDWDLDWEYLNSLSNISVARIKEGFLAVAYNGTDTFRFYVYDADSGEGYYVEVDEASIFGYGAQSWQEFLTYTTDYREDLTFADTAVATQNFYVDDSYLSESDIRTIIGGWGYVGSAATDITP